MIWHYNTNENNSARFTLGQYDNKTAKTLICFGINPSTATPQSLDNTINKIKTLAKHNGYLNWIMLNIYPQRATNPNNLHILIDKELHYKNLAAIQNLLLEFTNSDILFAYGNLISKRKYLSDCLIDIVNQIKISKWSGATLCIQLNKNGCPAHPLYQPNESKFIDYII